MIKNYSFKKLNIKYRVYLKILMLVVLISACSEEIIYTDVLPQLEIKTLDANGNVAQNVQVSLYLTEADWLENTNKIVQKTTDSNGNALFDNLEEKVYYIFAEKNNQNNLNGISFFSAPLRKNEVRVITTSIN
jgi:hypothetical protein